MKQFLSTILCNVKQFLSSKFSDAKQFLAPKLCNTKQFLSSKLSGLNLPVSPKWLALVAVLLLVLVIGLSRCSGKEVPPAEPPAPTEAPAVLETEPVSETENAAVVTTMGTVTADKLNVRKGPDSKYETNGAYYKGDRIEILEIQTVDDTTWGRTGLGWVGMGYVKLDGAAADNVNSKLISNGSTDVLGYGVVDLKELNVRLGPDTDYDIVCTVTQGVRYAYYQISSSYENWVRIEDGWVSTEHFYLEGTVADDALTGTVNAEELNIRTGPNTGFLNVGTYALGDTVEILAQVGAWGYTERGWVSMNYVDPQEPVYSTGTGTITSGLNIRQEPNADSDIMGTYTTGDRVIVVEVIDNWGRTDLGWINLKYIAYD